ncbi:MAG: sigma-70 family RNA polymerase sigma factor [Bryobacterales bacterium]|nr:sigma-70 family RNA polymerase sigma factor [Bryobacterales bacterium]
MQPEPQAATTDVTLLLTRWSEGDADAFDRASAVIYPELRRIADSYLRRERTGHTLQPTALIHEAFLRLTGIGNLKFESRKHFFALAAQLMRQILVDHARSMKSQKRGGGAAKYSLDAAAQYTPSAAEQFLAVHEALDELRTVNPRKAQVIELRYFGGLNLEEVSDILSISVTTAHREQRLAEAWLTDRISG